MVVFINTLVDPRIGFRAVQVLADARSVDELDYAIGVINNSYQIIRGQIEVMELLRGGPLDLVEKDNKD